MGGFSLLPPSGPSQRDPQALRNPFLDEIDRAATDAHAKLSPGAQESLRRAGAPLPQAQAGTPSLITSPKAAPPPMNLGGQRPMSEQPPSGTPDVISAMPSSGIHSPTGPSVQTAPPVKITPPTTMAGPAQDEYNRLTIGKQATAGVNQIKSPWARVPLQVAAGLAETFAPRFAAAIPGTESHHQLLVGQAGEAVDQQNRQREEEEKASTAAATQAHLEAESANQMAQATREKQSPHPTITTDKGIMQWNPQTGRFDIPAGNAPVKEEMEGKTITTDQGIMQWNPATKSYDIKAGDSAEKDAAEKTLQDADGVWYKVGHDNAAVPITLNGQPFKGKLPTASAGDDFTQFYQKWLKEKGIPDSATNEKKARAEWSASNQTPERPPQAMMLVPGQNGQMTATVVRPGSTVAPGALTTAGASGETVAANKEAQEEAKVKAEAAKSYRLAQTLVANPSPTNDLALVMQYIGSTKPESLGKLRLNNNEVNLVYGTRSSLGDLQALISKVQTGQSLTPKQRQDMLNTMKVLAESRGDAIDGNQGGGSVGSVRIQQNSKGEFRHSTDGGKTWQAGRPPQ